MKRKVICILLTSMLALTACGNSSSDPLDGMNRAQLREAYMALQNNYTSLANQYESLNTMYQALSSDELATSAVSSVGDGTTGEMTFNSADSKIIFPSSFQYPGSEAIQANGKIDIVNNVSVAPGSNWITKLNGSTLELQHSSGISATIKVSGVTESYDKNLLQSEVLQQWFINVPQSQVKYTNIFIDSNMFGVQATTPTMIDSENAFLRCGMLSYGDYAITYVFVYRGEQDVTKDESIVNLINSMTVTGNKISVES